MGICSVQARGRFQNAGEVVQHCESKPWLLPALRAIVRLGRRGRRQGGAHHGPEVHQDGRRVGEPESVDGAVEALAHQARNNRGLHRGWGYAQEGEEESALGRSMFLCAKSRHAVGAPATHRFAVPCSAGGITRSPNAIDPTVPTAAAPSITAPAAAASAMGAACSTVPSAATGARLVDFAHGWYVKGQARALGVDLR